MDILINDIGKLKSASIKIGSVAVLAGQNNSGKSTVGKILYSVYRAIKGGRDIRASLMEDFDEIVRFGCDTGHIKVEGDLKCDIRVDRNNKVDADFKPNQELNMVYIDDPNILDFPTDVDYLDQVLNSRRLDLLGMLKNKQGNPIEIEELNRTVAGSLELREGRFYYCQDKKISMHNTSSGVKMLLILKTILKNGWLNGKSLLIFDEPEVHLHPDWQLVFARTCVKLICDYGLKIILNTHSPYLVNAFEVYAAKEELNARFYLTKSSEDYSEIIEVTKDLDLVYKELAEAFGRLENEAYD